MHIRDAVKTLEPYRPGQTAHDLRRFGITDCVKLGSNENPLGPAPAVCAAMEESLKDVRLYPESGAPRLREALAKAYSRKTEEVITGSGIDDLLDLTARCLLDPGDNLVLAHPGFIRYAVAARMAGGEVHLVPGEPSTPYTHHLNGMLEAIDDRTRIVVLVNPNNPTGSMFTRDALEAFLERVPERVLTILDEAYFEFVEHPDYPDGLDYVDSTKPLLVFRTFSKIHSLAGIRVGFGIGPPDLVGHLDRGRLPFNVSGLAQVAAITAIGQEEHVKTSRALARTETTFLSDGLTERGWMVEPTWTNFVFARSPIFGNLLAPEVMQRGFILRPLTSFGLSDHFFRISHGTREQNIAFLAALDDAMKEIQRS